MYVCVGLKVVELLNLLLEAALVLIKFNTRWHNSIKPPQTTTNHYISCSWDFRETTPIFKLSGKYWTTTNHDIKPPWTMTLNHHEPLQTTTNHHELLQTTTNHYKPPQTMTLNHHKPPWTTMNHHKPPQTTMNHHKLPQTMTLNHHELWDTQKELCIKPYGFLVSWLPSTITQSSSESSLYNI